MTTVTTSNGVLKIIQGNILHCKLANSTLCHSFMKKNLDFAMIQEPYVNKKRFIQWNKLKGTMFTDYSAGKVRTCIFAKSNPNYTVVAISEFCNQDLTTVRVDYKINDKPETVILASAYLPYEERNPPSQQFQNLVSFCKNGNFELIISCDANAHHTVWGSTDIYPRGKSLSEYLSSTNLLIQNKGNTPTFVNKIRREVIDITLATHRVSRDIKCWRVEPEVTFSDHKWITFEIKSNTVPPIKFRNPRNTNWETFRENLSSRVDSEARDILSRDEIDVACEKLTNSILESYEASCPLSSPPPPGKNPGWTKELTELKREARRSFNEAYNLKRLRLPKAKQDELWELHHIAKAKWSSV